jgi:predicted ATP-dependent endonuclease of OLD family
MGAGGRHSGIVLIDEPDLHLHVSLATAFVSHVRRTVADKGGQLIVTSHMPELWGLFTDSHRIRLDATPVGVEAAL